jgi:hypothetical protein
MVSGENVLIASNRFTDRVVGITLFGNEPFTLWYPEFRTTLSSATNPRVLGNRFCGSFAAVINRGASGVTEEGSLSCPFPDPILEIAPAAILSWPAYTEGWTLESAPTVHGPWMAVAATSTVESDQNTIALRTESQQRFFRLHKP